MDVLVHMKDKVEAVDSCSLSNTIKERTSAGPKRTKITFKNHDTGEVLGEFENKIVISGSQFNACSVFGLDPVLTFPTYNTEMGLDNSDTGVDPKNTPIVCLFCVSDSGCGTTPKDVYVANYTDRIKPAPKDPTSADDFDSTMIMPFRFVDITDDLSSDLRKYYFGRKTFTDLGKIGYYFKTFDTDPQLHLRYADGTQITEYVYDNESDQLAECYVETRLRITRYDLRDYFEDILGWDKARISSLSLCFAWYDDTKDEYKYFQDITPYTLLNFSYQWLVDDTIAIDILYDIFF